MGEPLHARRRAASTIAAVVERSILIVDDNPAYGRLTELLLRDALDVSHEVRHATTLRGALEALSARPADCLLLDLTLPDSEGLGSIERLRAADAGVPIVVVSGRSEPGLVDEAIARGASGFVVKGDEREYLGVTVSAALAASTR
jgi:CheY-like chemotaxis protein